MLIKHTNTNVNLRRRLLVLLLFGLFHRVVCKAFMKQGQDFSAPSGMPFTVLQRDARCIMSFLNFPQIPRRVILGRKSSSVAYNTFAILCYRLKRLNPIGKTGLGPAKGAAKMNEFICY